jgi:uncharacterized protein (DUF697 family)
MKSTKVASSEESTTMNEEFVEETSAQNDDAIKPSELLEDARQIVKKNTYWAMGVGLVPMPVVDILGVGAFQAKSLKELSDLYGITFFEHKVKNIIAVLVSGLSTPVLATALFGTMVKFIPGLGTLMGIAATPAIAGAVTFATGQVFIQHFESGGTFLDFNPQKVKDYFNEQIKIGMELAKEKEESPVTEAASAKN